MRALYAIPLLLIPALQVVSGCSCSPLAYAPLCQRIGDVQVLFLGTPVATNDNHEGLIQSGTWYKFKVEEGFKGLAPGTTEVIVDPSSGTSCQEEFSLGKRYLISAYGGNFAEQNAAAISRGNFPVAPGAARPPGPLVFSGTCSGSRLAEHAATDLAFLRRFLAGKSTPSIFGNVRIHASEWLWSDRYPPLPRASIRLIGAGSSRTALTDANGHYEFANVEPGVFTLSASSPGFTPARQKYEVTVPPGGCGVANIGMFSKGFLKGKVVEQDGRPAQNVAVEYRYSDANLENPYPSERSTKTDGQGRFAFSHVPPGNLLLGVHLDSAPTADQKIPPTYFPGVTAIEKATVLRLTPSGDLHGLTIRLGPRATLRKVRVTLRWPDGRPAPEAHISTQANGHTAELGKTDSQGNFEFSMLNGIAYKIEARAWTSFRVVMGNRIGHTWVDAETIEIPASSQATEANLVLNKPMPKR